MRNKLLDNVLFMKYLMSVPATLKQVTVLIDRYIKLKQFSVSYIIMMTICFSCAAKVLVVNIVYLKPELMPR